MVITLAGVENVEHIIAIEILCATQGIDFRKLEKEVVLGKGSRIAYDLARKTVPQLTQVNDKTHDRLTQDVLVHKDITSLWELVHKGRLVSQVHAKLSELTN